MMTRRDAGCVRSIKILFADDAYGDDDDDHKKKIIIT